VSSALAIAAVTAVLKDLLDNAVIDPSASDALGSSITVTALAPDLIKVRADEPPRLNLFMYHVTPNQGWRNVDLPARNGSGARIANPPLALDLHYMLTAYASKDFHAEILLGYAMQLLHEFPVLTRGAVTRALSPKVDVDTGLPIEFGKLIPPDLADQIELVKIMPEIMSIEEMSKLWAAIQGHYRPTAAYRASVVLIRSDAPVRAPLPVRERRLHVHTLSRPSIDAVDPQFIAAGGVLALRGSNLHADLVRVSFGDELIAPDTATDSRITVALPAGLPAGINMVQVHHPIDFGTGSPAEPHRGVESNAAAFIIVPTIVTAPPYAVARGGTLALKVDPPVTRMQNVRLLVGERSIAIPPRPLDTSADPPVEPPPSPDLEFPIPGDFPQGTYPLRVEVDGAQSRLQQNPVSYEFDAPSVEITA